MNKAKIPAVGMGTNHHDLLGAKETSSVYEVHDAMEWYHGMSDTKLTGNLGPPVLNLPFKFDVG